MKTYNAYQKTENGDTYVQERNYTYDKDLYKIKIHSSRARYKIKPDGSISSINRQRSGDEIKQYAMHQLDIGNNKLYCNVQKRKLKEGKINIYECFSFATVSSVKGKYLGKRLVGYISDNSDQLILYDEYRYSNDILKNLISNHLVQFQSIITNNH